jgi:hypothetical protein
MIYVLKHFLFEEKLNVDPHFTICISTTKRFINRSNAATGMPSKLMALTKMTDHRTKHQREIVIKLTLFKCIYRYENVHKVK